MTAPEPARRGTGLELFFGVWLPSLVLGPFMVFGLLGLVITALTRSSQMAPMSWQVMGIFLALMVIAGCALGSLWLVLTQGPDWFRAQPALRWSALAAGAAGLLVAVWTMWVSLPSGNLSALLLLGPVIVGLRHLPALLVADEGRPGRGRSR